MALYDIRPIVQGIVAVCGGPAPLHKTELGWDDWCIVNEEMHDPFGYHAIEVLQSQVRDYTRATHAIAFGSGTAALKLALLAVGVKPYDEVICPALTFAGTAHAISHCGAVPHLVDVERETFGIDAERLDRHLAALSVEDLFHIKAIVPVDLLGLPCDLAGIVRVAERYEIPVVEDAAEALGSWRGAVHCGVDALVSVLSFNNNKIVTTGGGGMLLTNDAKLAELALHLGTTARVPHRWQYLHSTVGWNDRMPNMSAAMAIGQMKRLKRTLELKRIVAQKYRDVFADTVDCRLHDTWNYWLNALPVDIKYPQMRVEILRVLHSKGIQPRPLFVPLHRHPAYRLGPRMDDLSVSEYLAATMLCLPSSPALGETDEDNFAVRQSSRQDWTDFTAPQNGGGQPL